MDAFIEAKGSNGWRRSSLISLASSLRSFFYYAEGRGWGNPGIDDAIESPRLYAQEGIPEGPSWKDVQRLLASTRGDRPSDVRDHAILMLLAILWVSSRRGCTSAVRQPGLGRRADHGVTPQATAHPMLFLVVRSRRGHPAVFAYGAATLHTSDLVSDLSRSHSSTHSFEHNCYYTYTPKCSGGNLAPSRSPLSVARLWQPHSRFRLFTETNRRSSRSSHRQLHTKLHLSHPCWHTPGGRNRSWEVAMKFSEIVSLYAFHKRISVPKWRGYFEIFLQADR